MIRGLIEKELRQSRLAFLMMLLFLGVGLWAVLRSPLLLRSGGSSFEVLRMLIYAFMPLACLVLAQSLIAGEFRQRSQLFLEGLPLPRWRMIAVKYFLGLAMVWLVTLAIGTAAWWHTQGEEALTQRFLMLLAAKALGWASFCWCAFFALGFLGRYRLIVTLIIVIGLLVAESEGEMISRLGPFDLLNRRFAFERFVWPVRSLQITGLLIAALTALGFGLGLVRDASVATMLAEKMSAREKVMIGIITIMVLMSIGFVEEKKRDAGPVHLPGSVDVEKGAASVSVAAAVETMTDEETKAVNQWAEKMATMLTEMAQWLHCEHLPTLFLVHRRDFDANQREDGALDSRQGYMLRLNLTKRPPEDLELQEEIIWMLLRARQHYRLPSDTNGWVLDGFASWWPRRHLPQSPDQTSARSISAEDLQHWLKVRDGAGNAEARKLGANVLAALERSAGATKRQQFVAAVLGARMPHDARATIKTWLYPIPRTFEQITGMSLEAFASEWKKASAKQEVKP